jgi:hypothetical protein
MKKIVLITLLIIVSSIIVYLFVNSVLFENAKNSKLESYSTQIIKLEPQIFEKSNRGIGECAVPWWMAINCLVTIDEHHNIYILDIYKNRIVHLQYDGKLLKRIYLKNINYKNLSCECRGCPLIQVAPQGNLFYLISGDGQHISLYNSEGIPIKKILSTGFFDRQCDGTIKTSNEIWDMNLNVVTKIPLNSNNGYYDIKSSSLYSLDEKDKLVLIKKNLDGRKMWTKKIMGYEKIIGFLGIDREDNIYIRMDNPFGIVKITEDGTVIAKITFPPDLKLLKFATFQVLCDGTIYGFPSHVDITSGKAEKAKGLYVIYKFVKR